MSKEYFTDNIKDEALAKLTDKMLNFEKTSERRNIKTNMLRIIPAVAAIVLVIGAINMLPAFLKSTSGPADNGKGSGVNAAVASVTDDTSDYVNIPTYTSETTSETVSYYSAIIISNMNLEDILADSPWILPINGIENNVYDSIYAGNKAYYSAYSTSQDNNVYDSTSEDNSDPYFSLTYGQDETVEYKNGITVKIPMNTKLECNYGNYTLTVGDGDATITQPDGTTSIVPSGTVLDGEGNVADNTETVTTQIGELSITTPKGQEPIQNDDGTITLPGGGTYINLSGDKVTASSSTIIRKNGDFTISDEINTDVTIIVESPDGTITTVTQGIMRTNKGLNNIPSESVNNSSDKNSEQDISWPWTTESASDNTKIYEFTDGTKITSFSMATEIYNPGYNTNYQTLPGNYINRSEYTVRYDSKCTIEFTNGVTVNAPINTSANITEGKLTITIGDGDATITQPDGTTSTVPSGTVLDE